MSEYSIANVMGPAYSFTVKYAERRGIRILADNVDMLGNAFSRVKITIHFK